MPNDDPIVPRQAGLQTLPFVREKLFASEPEPQRDTVSDRLRQLVPFLIPICIVGLILIDKSRSGTVLVSPANPVLLFVMCGLGALIGAPIGFKAAANAPGVLYASLAFITVLAAHMLAFNSAAWRIASWWEFGGSEAEFSEARFPVKSAARNKGSISLRIDPFGTHEDTALPTMFDPDEINAHPGAYCVTVRHRRSSSGAVQIYRSGYYQPRLCSD